MIGTGLIATPTARDRIWPITSRIAGTLRGRRPHHVTRDG
jgi:hypothetical protein